MVATVFDSSNEVQNQLVSELEKRVKETFPEAEVSVQETLKNNSVHRTQLQVQIPDYYGKAVPLIPLEAATKQILDGDCSIDEAAAKLVTEFKAALNGVDLPEINNEMAKRSLFVSIVNRGMNEELLKDVPYTPVATDLALVPRIKVPLKGEGMASFVVHKSILPQIEMTEAEVLETALRNFSTDTYSIRSMEEMMIEDFGMPEEVVRATTPDIPMYVITNDERMGGAVGPFVSKELRQRIFDKVGCDQGFILLPSSTSETIGIPATNSDVEALREIVNQVNSEAIDDGTLILSGNVYFCNDKLELTMVGDKLDDTDLLGDTETVTKGMHL